MATGSPVQPERLNAGLERLKQLGFTVEVPLDPSKYYGQYDFGFANGSPGDRAAALMQLVNDSSVDLIIAARGGYGSMDLLPLIDYEAIGRSKKAVVGYSDVTVLLAAVHNRTGLAVVHGPTISKEFAESAQSPESDLDAAWLIALMSGKVDGLGALPCRRLDAQITGRSSSKKIAGKVAGPAVPGNLTMLQSLLGTQWDPSYEGAVLIIEEIGEQPYRVHRALTQLALAGKLERVAGIVFGRFSGCEGKHGPNVEAVWRSLLEQRVLPDIPVFDGLAFGHNGANRAVPFGCTVEIEYGANGAEFRIVESPV